jgi:hypothetical protein
MEEYLKARMLKMYRTSYLHFEEGNASLPMAIIAYKFNPGDKTDMFMMDQYDLSDDRSEADEKAISHLKEIEPDCACRVSEAWLAMRPPHAEIDEDFRPSKVSDRIEVVIIEGASDGIRLFLMQEITRDMQGNPSLPETAPEFEEAPLTAKSKLFDQVFQPYEQRR